MDATGHPLAHGAGQRGAARVGVVAAAHPAQRGGQVVGQAVGYAATFTPQFGAMEIHPERRAAGAAAGAGVVFSHRGGSEVERNSSVPERRPETCPI